MALLWEKARTSFPTVSRARRPGFPTWSWVSIHGSVSFPVKQFKTVSGFNPAGDVAVYTLDRLVPLPEYLDRAGKRELSVPGALLHLRIEAPTTSVQLYGTGVQWFAKQPQSISSDDKIEDNYPTDYVGLVNLDVVDSALFPARLHGQICTAIRMGDYNIRNSVNDEVTDSYCILVDE